MGIGMQEAAGWYGPEELMPIVAELAEAYTMGESSSVSYERARALMETVLWCIAHRDGDDSDYSRGELPAAPLSARDSYRLGLRAIQEKVRTAKERYEELMTVFDAYGNRCCRETVEKGLPAFFRYYDIRFAPADTIITMDYPVPGLDTELEGIDRISAYIDAIREEQAYLRQFPRSYVVDKLRSFHPAYENEFFNLKEIMERPVSLRS